MMKTDQTPAPASVTPASDVMVAFYKRCGAVSNAQGMELIARIESEKAANAELREEGQKLKTVIDDLKRTVTEASMRRHEEIASLRARLAEVREAAASSLKVWGTAGAGHALRVAMTDLESILAKGDKS